MIRSASTENGMVCSQTLPGPVNVARKKPSPLKNLFFNPFTVVISKLTLSSNAAIYP